MCSGSTLCVQGVPYVIREYPMCSGSTLCVQGVPYVLEEHTEVLPTPGHTGSDISVVVRNTPIGTVVVAGTGRSRGVVEHRLNVRLSTDRTTGLWSITLHCNRLLLLSFLA